MCEGIRVGSRWEGECRKVGCRALACAGSPRCWPRYGVSIDRSSVRESHGAESETDELGLAGWARWRGWLSRSCAVPTRELSGADVALEKLDPAVEGAFCDVEVPVETNEELGLARDERRQLEPRHICPRLCLKKHKISAVQERVHDIVCAYRVRVVVEDLVREHERDRGHAPLGANRSDNVVALLEAMNEEQGEDANRVCDLS